MGILTKITFLRLQTPVGVQHTSYSGKLGLSEGYTSIQCLAHRWQRSNQNCMPQEPEPFLLVTPEVERIAEAGKPRQREWQQPAGFSDPSYPVPQLGVTQRRLSPGNGHSLHLGSLPSSLFPLGSGNDTGSLNPRQGTMTTL